MHTKQEGEQSVWESDKNYLIEFIRMIYASIQERTECMPHIYVNRLMGKTWWNCMWFDF